MKRVIVSSGSLDAFAYESALEAAVQLTARVPPVEPMVGLQPAIESALVLLSQPRPLPQPALAPAPPARVAQVMHDSAAGPAANDAIWRSLRRWQWIGSAAVAACAVPATALG